MITANWPIMDFVYTSHHSASRCRTGRQRALNRRTLRPMKSRTLTYVVVLACCACCGCGGTEKHATAAKGDSAGSSKEEQCFAGAAAHSEPKPDAPIRITVSQIIVRHAELAHPQGATRTRGQACLRALQALTKLKDGADWAKVVEEYSDSPGPSSATITGKRVIPAS